jgi:hypothetical protein
MKFQNNGTLKKEASETQRDIREETQDAAEAINFIISMNLLNLFSCSLDFGGQRRRWMDFLIAQIRERAHTGRV